MMRRILVGVTGAPTISAEIEYARDLALRHHAWLDLVSLIDIEPVTQIGGPLPFGAGHVAERLRDDQIRPSREAAESAINRFDTECAKAGVPIEVIRESGNPFTVFTDRSRYNDLSILAVRGWFDHRVVDEPVSALLGLVVRGVRPILSVPEVVRPIRRALICYDGSMEAAKAMKRFIQMRLWPDVSVHIACFDKPRREAEPLLDDATAYCRAHDYRTTAARIAGKPATAIPREAEQSDADVIVIGSSFHRALLHRVFSDTALKVIRSADRPVFMAH